MIMRFQGSVWLFAILTAMLIVIACAGGSTPTSSPADDQATFEAIEVLFDTQFAEIAVPALEDACTPWAHRIEDVGGALEGNSDDQLAWNVCYEVLRGDPPATVNQIQVATDALDLACNFDEGWRPVNPEAQAVCDALFEAQSALLELRLGN